MGAVLLALAAAAVPATAQPQAPAAPGTIAEANSSLVMVLDSSGSMADDDGSGGTRIEAAREAVGTVVDTLPDGHPTGLRVYGADRTAGCTDTRLVKPVEPLDRSGIKRAVAAVEPKGDTPIGLSLRKAAEDLPDTPDGALGNRTILLVSDGEDTCGTPDPCKAAEQLARDGGSSAPVRIDAIGFQVRGAARDELRCIAEAGHGSYYDAPDADALARQLQRAARLSADGYRFRGDRITGGRTADRAAGIEPGQYVDTLGPGETRWYSARLDDASAADLAVTAVPQPGVPVGSTDGIEVRLTTGDARRSLCDRGRAVFGQDEGAHPLTAAAGRIPSEGGSRTCDEAGTYHLAVTRESAADADRARWPVEIRYGVEEPLDEGVTPAQSAPEYGAGGEDARLPTGTPEDVEGGTGFNDAARLRTGVWRDTLLPAQTRWYKVPVGWGQQLRYDVEIANEPTLTGHAGTYSFVRTDVYAPGRLPLAPDGEFTRRRSYTGEPTAVSLGTVPVSWTNRYENAGSVTPVRRNGAYYLAVTLGAETREIAENAAVGVVLRVDVKGREKSGPQHGAPPVRPAADEAKKQGAQADSGGGDGAGWSGPVTAAVAGGAGVLLLAALAVAYARARRRDTDSTRGGAW